MSEAGVSETERRSQESLPVFRQELTRLKETRREGSIFFFQVYVEGWC